MPVGLKPADVLVAEHGASGGGASVCPRPLPNTTSTARLPSCLSGDDDLACGHGPIGASHMVKSCGKDFDIQKARPMSPGQSASSVACLLPACLPA